MALIGSILQLLIAGFQLQNATLEFYQHHIELDLIMAASTLSDPLEHYLEGESSREMQGILSRLETEAGSGFQLLDRNYNIISSTPDILSSDENRSKLLNQSRNNPNRIISDIQADATNQSRLYVATTVTYEGDILGYLILSQLMQPAYNEVNQNWLELTTATLPVLILAMLASIWISGTILRPVQKLQDSALQMADGKLATRITIQSRDEIGQLAHAFNFMAERLETLIKAQRSFVNNAAHELRTPLMNLKLRIEALEDKELDQATRANYFSELHEEIDNMAEMVSSLLILARIDEGRHEETEHTTDTSTLLSDISRYWSIKAKQKNLAFVQDIPADLPSLTISPNDLRLVLNNIIGNAIKYTNKGSVNVQVHQVNNELKIQIQDTGVGFELEQNKQLFERFYRTEKARAQFQGTGLGLSIVKTLLDERGGNIEGKSKGTGQGATFTLTLPYHDSAVG
jgi:signal transduction histidine kinase